MLLASIAKAFMPPTTRSASSCPSTTNRRDYLKIVLGSESRADDAIVFQKVHNLEDLQPLPSLLAQIVPQLAQLEARQMRGEIRNTLYEDPPAGWRATAARPSLPTPTS